jgi:hypothetical protein
MVDLLQAIKAGNLVILGKRGSGKTTLALQAAAFRPAGLIVDTLGDIDVGQEVEFYDLAGVERWRRFNLPDAARGSGIGIDTMAAGVFTAVYRLAEARCLPRPFTLLVDEADRHGHASWNTAALKDTARYGRHWGLQYIITARRYAEVPKDWTSNADLVLMGPSLDPADADTVRRIAGPHARIWAHVKAPDFLGIGVDGAAIYRYNSVDDSIEAESL